jgi:alpha-glucosidase
MGQFYSQRSTRLGNVVSASITDAGVTGKTGNGNFRAIYINNNIIRITATRQDDFEDFSYSVIAHPEKVKLNIQDSEYQLSISSPAVQLVIQKQPATFSFQTPSGDVIHEDESLGICWNGEQVTSYKRLQHGERFIGLGEKTGPLDRRGNGYQHWNTDNFAYHSGADPLYCSTPFYIGIHHHHVYGIFLDNTFKSFFNFGASNNRFSSISVDNGEMNYYFIYGQTVAEIIQHYTLLTGRTPLPARWSIGYQQCRYSYFPDKEVLSVANAFREKDIPADVIVLDIHYMEQYKIFTWHKEHFSNPKKLIDELKSKGFEVVVMCDPGIKVEKGYEAYEDGVDKKVFIQYPDGENYTAQVWPGWCHFPDFTNPKTRQWWKEKFRDYVSQGVAGFWNDMNEIATWGNQLPENLELDFEGNKDSMRRGRNLYGMQMARATYEGTKELLKGRRPFNLTRSGFSGVQRYAAVWTGDNVATDEHMMLGVRMLNSMGLAGVAFCGYDVGGFVGDANPKLFARWISLGAFSPFFRGHSMVNSRDSEPWSFGEEVEEISRNYIKLRYRLMPYLYAAFYEATQTGMPVNRSLAIHYPFDSMVYQGHYQHQYFFGPSLLVAPIESYKDLMKVYLPPGNWYHFFDDRKFSAGEAMVECPVDKLPVFVKGSSIVIMNDASGSHTKERSSTLEVHVYNGTETTSFLHYDDDGETFDYQRGNFSLRKFQLDAPKRLLTIEKPGGLYPSPYKKAVIYFHGYDSVSTAKVNNNAAPVQTTDYRFLAPLRSFDPVGSVNEGYKINQLPFLQLELTNENITIAW